MFDKSKIYIGFTASSGFVAKMIKWFTGGDVNHVFLLYWSEHWKCWVNHGAESRGFISTFAGDTDPVVERMVALYDIGDLRPGMAASSKFLGVPYDYMGLLGMTWVEFSLHRLKKQVKNPLEAKKAVFCSEMVRKVIRSSPSVDIPGLALSDGATDPEMIQSAIEQAGFGNLLS